MLSILDRPGRLCDGWSRRELLQIGTLGLFGLGLPQLLKGEERARAKRGGEPGRVPDGSRGFGRAKSVILLYLQGAPSHIDLWDPKPDAPSSIRGEFRPIATSAPGVFLGEVLPRLARHADKFALIRSLGFNPKGLANHGAAIYTVLTGHDPTNFTPTGLAVPPSRDDLPSVGSSVAKFRPSDAGALSYVALCGPVKENVFIGVAQSAGLLGNAFDPYTMYDDPTGPLRAAEFTLPPEMTLGRLRARLDLRAAARASDDLGPIDFETFYTRAFSLIESARADRAFRLDQEAASTRAEYGPTRFGQSCLVARRLVESGARFVQVTWPARSDDEPAAGPDGSWDTHRNNFPMLREHRCPVFDQSAAALLADLAARGLLDETLVVAIGEFGRSPRIGASTTMNVGPGGRDHWPHCYSALVAGGGIQGGQVHGESDKHGAFPKANPVHPFDLIATLYHALGINPALRFQDVQNRPRRLVDHGEPILELFT
ncbi:DUF1501 domain-containing protein [Singulisphaera sp. Ch08]|uniref:DUF1501 domain-containing protein n=1 Tax=Singulisphaera sp. Ch08 TaxID=3120278 RepID=A0AAU7C9X1_9BACT